MADWNNNEDILFPLAELCLSFLRGVDRFSVALAAGALCVFLPVVRHLTRSKIWKLCLALISEMWMFECYLYVYFCCKRFTQKMSSNLVPDLGASETPAQWRRTTLVEKKPRFVIFVSQPVYMSSFELNHLRLGVSQEGPQNNYQVISCYQINDSRDLILWHVSHIFVTPFTFGIYSSLTCFSTNGSKFGQAMGLEPPAPLVASLGS